MSSSPNSSSNSGNSDDREGGTRSRLLVVDDEPAVVKLLGSLLNRAGFRADPAQSAREAMDILERETFDCVITDAIMPGETGFDLVRKIRKNPSLADLPIIMLTRKRHREDVQEAMDAGVTDYVLKPIDEQLLLQKVELSLKKSDGKRHVAQWTTTHTEYPAEIALPCRIVALSESELTLRVPAPLASRPESAVSTRIFEDIGISSPTMKLVSCTEGAEWPGFALYPFEARYALIGMTQADLKKIRAWIQKQELRLRK